MNRQWYLLAGKCNRYFISLNDAALPGAALGNGWFESWDALIEQLGLRPSEIRKLDRHRYDTPESILAVLRDAHSKGIRLTPKHLNAAYSNLNVGMKTHFSSWTAARAAAGTPLLYCPRGGRKEITAEEVLQTLKDRHREGKNLNERVVRQEIAFFYHSLLRHFGKWKEAMTQAGLGDLCGKFPGPIPADLPQLDEALRAYPAEENVMVELRRIVEKDGPHVRTQEIRSGHPLLARAILHFFPSIYHASFKAGFRRSSKGGK